jgi:integrase
MLLGIVALSISALSHSENGSHRATGGAAMPAKVRFKTKYPGVYYIESTVGQTGKSERVYYIVYRKDGKLIEEKAGRQFQDDMTPARASELRGERMRGKDLSNKERRQAEKEAKEADAGRWTVARLWSEYRNQKGAYKTLRTDETNFKYIQPSLGGKEPAAIIPLEVDRLRIRLSKQMQPQTVKHVLALLNRIVNFGVKKGLCKGLGFKIEMPKVHGLKTEDLTPDQMGRLLQVINEDSNTQAANLMKMALFTGMRRGEMFKLKWDDINFDRGFIHIRDPKGGPSQKIPLNEAARGLLESHPRTDSPYVFPGRNGEQRTDIKHQANRIKEKAGLPKDFRPLHGLRHVYASMLASSGQVDLYTLQKLLTHKSPAMTQRYAHLRDETLKKASDLAAELIKGAEHTADSHKPKAADRIG